MTQYSQIKSIILRWPGWKKIGSAFKILTGKPYRRLLGRPRHRWMNSIRMDLKEIGVDMRNWIDTAQNKDYWIAIVNV